MSMQEYQDFEYLRQIKLREIASLIAAHANKSTGFDAKLVQQLNLDLLKYESIAVTAAKMQTYVRNTAAAIGAIKYARVRLSAGKLLFPDNFKVDVFSHSDLMFISEFATGLWDEAIDDYGNLKKAKHPEYFAIWVSSVKMTLEGLYGKL